MQVGRFLIALKIVVSPVRVRASPLEEALEIRAFFVAEQALPRVAPGQNGPECLMECLNSAELSSGRRWPCATRDPPRTRLGVVDRRASFWDRAREVSGDRRSVPYWTPALPKLSQRFLHTCAPTPLGAQALQLRSRWTVVGRPLRSAVGFSNWNFAFWR